MADQTPKPLRYEETEKGPVVRALEGAITTRPLPANEIPRGRDHMFECVSELDRPRFVQLKDQKPPLHFRSCQHEFMQVLEGRLCYEVEGQELMLTPDDGEICIKPSTHHRILPTPPTDAPSGRRSVFTLSGTGSDQAFKLDEIFYENWDSYQEEFIVHGGSISLLQILIMFDAGGSYLTLPSWASFGKQISYYVLGIGMGMYLAAAFGYQPYYRERTTKWDEACRKMETTFFQRRFAKRQ